VIPILTAAKMRAADAAAMRRGVPSLELMERAASALAEAVEREAPECRRVVLLCGPGNNGGDGLAAARLLAQRGVSARLFTLAEPEKLRGDAAVNLGRARRVGLIATPLTSPRGRRELAEELSSADVVVDALFGTGLTRPLSATTAAIVRAIEESRRLVVSADVPSGLSSDSGKQIGPAVRAHRTVAFGAPKLCHVLYPARAHCGELTVADIGIPIEEIWKRERHLCLLQEEDVARKLPRRRADSNKGDHGRVAIVAGSRGKAGAAILAARGALRAGAGLVTVLCIESMREAVVTALPEAMSFGLPEEDGALAAEAAKPALALLKGMDAAVIGPGLGTAPGTVEFLEQVLGAGSGRDRLVCDADALNAFAGRKGLARYFVGTTMTPHPGEAGRLLGTSAKQVQADRIGAALRLARRTKATVVLKGAGTLVADLDGSVTANPTGSPLMATAGSGDVLSGVIAGLIAATGHAATAAYCAAFLHGRAGELLAERLGDAGLLAHELADEIPRVRRGLVRS
jgi:NAD(P)H-hydrate epimerase